MNSKVPKFYAIYKKFNGEMASVDVIPYIMDMAFNEDNSLSKRGFRTFDEKGNHVLVTSKELLGRYVKSQAMHHFWGDATWEFIAMDWPYRDEVKVERDGDKADLISINHPHKISVYDIIEPNLGLITDLLWDFIGKKIEKLKK